MPVPQRVPAAKAQSLNEARAREHPIETPGSYADGAGRRMPSGGRRTTSWPAFGRRLYSENEFLEHFPIILRYILP